ncbi:MAG: hypothetical protein JXA22_10085 [Candidatus Thermoplasmatota archaeon]|nr:hypothetical protein [Candidatus Thermoplasmatota archaeon]
MKRMTIIGIVLLVAGIVLGIGLVGGGISLRSSSDPASSNEHVITSSGGTAELGKGTHQIWMKDSVSGPMRIRTPGNVTFTLERSSDKGEFGDLSLWGEFKVEEEGEYRFEYAGTGDLYITKEIPLGTYTGMIYIGGIGGLLMILIGVVLIVIGTVRQKKLDQSSFFQDTPNR